MSGESVWVYLLSLVEKIPASFWGVMVGSLGSILTMALTNRSNTKRLLLQLDHDRSLRHQERDPNG